MRASELNGIVKQSLQCIAWESLRLVIEIDDKTRVIVHGNKMGELRTADVRRPNSRTVFQPHRCEVDIGAISPEARKVFFK